MIVELFNVTHTTLQRSQPLPQHTCIKKLKFVFTQYLVSDFVAIVAVEKQLRQDAADKQSHRRELHAQHVQLNKADLSTSTEYRPTHGPAVQTHTHTHAHRDDLVRSHAQDPTTDAELNQNGCAENVLQHLCSSA